LVPFDTQFLVANRLTNLPADLAAIGVRPRFPCRTGAATNSIMAVPVRSLPPKGPSRVTSTFLHIDGIEVKTLHFR
jgi:hypothetical protein